MEALTELLIIGQRGLYLSVESHLLTFLFQAVVRGKRPKEHLSVCLYESKRMDSYGLRALLPVNLNLFISWFCYRGNQSPQATEMSLLWLISMPVWDLKDGCQMFQTQTQQKSQISATDKCNILSLVFWFVFSVVCRSKTWCNTTAVCMGNYKNHKKVT